MIQLPTIAPALADLPHVPIDALVPFQGELKELSERQYSKLKKSILTEGIFTPFFVWHDNGIGRIIDGHQRERVMSREGWQMDVPVIYIDAANEQEAKRRLLLVSSQYGRVTQEGWDAFTFDLDSDWLKESVHFDALPFVFDEVPSFQPTTADEQPRLDEKSPVICPHCGLNIHEKPG